MLRTHSSLIKSVMALWPNTCCCVCIKYVSCPWRPAVFEQFGCLCFIYNAWAGFSGGKTQEDKLHVCYCLCTIQHIMWYMHTLLMIKVTHHEHITCLEDWILLLKTSTRMLLTSFSQNFSSNSTDTCMQRSSLNSAVLYYVYMNLTLFTYVNKR